MRREPSLRPENLLAKALDDIERLKEWKSRVGDGRGLVIASGTGAGSTTPPVEAGEHVLYGSKHTRSLAVTAGTGLNINYEQGQVWVNGTFFNIAAGTLLMVDDATNYVFVDSSGTVASNTTGFPVNGIPLAIVVTAGGVIMSINDRRAYLNADGWIGLGGILTTRGDLLTRDANMPVRLSIGTEGSILRSNGSEPVWTSNPKIAGWMRIGSNVDPSNVDSGDLTCSRLWVGPDDAFSPGVGLQAPVDVKLGTSTTKLGFFGATPVARAAAYTVTNVVPDRSYDASSTTVTEIANVLGTLIADLQSYGLLQ